jgi:hypothetical protein
LQRAQSGHLERVNGAGCDFVTQEGDTPAFPAQGSIFLDFFDPKAGCSMKIRAQISRIERKNQAWVYRIIWDQFPEILSQPSLN